MTMNPQPATNPKTVIRRIIKKAKGTARRSLDRAMITFSPKWYNKRFCSREGLWDGYFSRAEQSMATSWDQIIWPIIKDFDFDMVLELAPGAGRNTEKLAEVARVIHAVDLNEYALKRLRERFQSFAGKCELHFHQNRGSDLAMIDDCSITFLYCFDAAVHFDRTVMKAYVREFARVLRINGVGFVHHSNLGATAHVDIRKNPSWRSNMSKELFAQYCGSNGLQLIEQIELPWNTIVDCISVFRRSNLGLGDRN